MRLTRVRGTATAAVITSLVACAATLIAIVALTGCGLTIPSDPSGTLDRVEGEVLRAGASLDPGAVDREGARATGEIAARIEGFAREHDARVEWVFGSEETLVRLLESAALDVVIGGMTADTLWSASVGVSRSYPGLTTQGGRELVFLVPMGENRLLAELETYFDTQVTP